MTCAAFTKRALYLIVIDPQVLVVWNSPEVPDAELVWPEIHVPIKVRYPMPVLVLRPEVPR